MKKTINKYGNEIYLRQLVWYLNAPFMVRRIYRDKTGTVKLELQTAINVTYYPSGSLSGFETIKSDDDVVVKATDVLINKPKSKYRGEVK